MPAVVRSGAVFAFLVFSGACYAERPTFPSLFSTQPSSTSQPPPAGQPQPPPPEQPPLTGSTTTYVFSEPLGYPVSGFTRDSKFVLYDSGAFTLEYAGLGRPYLGAYRQENGRISFDFNANGAFSDASGDLKGDLLEVRYSDRMQHSDFENAVYRRSQ